MQIKTDLGFNLTLVKIANVQKKKSKWKANIDEDMKKSIIFTVGGNVNWYSHPGNRCGESSQTKIYSYHMTHLYYSSLHAQRT